ncbi:MAG: site-specific DNA-methyltransferase [Verrucomicrobium sp.]|nr:site-specific DNA-methyltransferase [Verrucomicrobium sp.]
MKELFSDGQVQVLNGKWEDFIGNADHIITDPDYGTTYQKWDKGLDLSAWWVWINKTLTPGGTAAFTSSQPFTSKAVMSRPEWFRWAWVWDKKNPTNFPNAKRQPLKVHEDVLVFCDRQPTYHPQMTKGSVNHSQGKSKENVSDYRLISKRAADDLSGMKYPTSIIQYAKHSSMCRWHTNQKPIELMIYLIKTLTNEGDLIIDSHAGSGTTLIAARACGRRAIGIEQDTAIAETAVERLRMEIF